MIDFFGQFPIEIDIDELENFSPHLSGNWSVADVKEGLIGMAGRNLVDMGFDEISFIDKWPGDTKIWADITGKNKFGMKVVIQVKFEILELGDIHNQS